MQKQVLPGRRQIVARPRLTNLLNQSDARVILLVAPAGYGKTTLAREWLAQGTGRVAWYTASPASTDVAALTAGIAAALSDDSTAVDRVRHWLRHARNPEDELENIISMLLHPEVRDTNPSRVVVDDYQQLTHSKRAQEMIQRLAFSSGDQWLIASRTRPSWATERQLLYGEVQELGAAALALTQDEALEVVKLSGGNAKRVAGLVELAEGWPAVIGLAARSGASDPPEAVVPGALHDFFAEELLQSVNPALRSDLQTLALVPPTSSDLAFELVNDPSGVLNEAQRIGFISLVRDQSYEMHPLLRSFLTRKAHDADGYSRRVRAIVEILASNARWDDALDVIDQSGELSLLSSILARGLDDLLEDGRVETVERWLERARAGRIDTPELDLADAEVALRRGDYLRAETLALRVDTKRRSDLSVRALICAGRSAHMADRYSQAREHFARAKELAVDQNYERDSVWGEMLATHQIAPGASRALLARFGELSDESPETALRVFIGEYQLADAIGGLEPLVGSGRSLLPIAERARDPFIRSSFFDSLCRVFFLTGNYAEAHAMTDLEIEEAKRYALRFVLPLALCGRAFAELGMRRFAQAWAHADEADLLAREMGDVHSIFQAAVIRARICLARGDAHEALWWLRDVDRRRPGGGMWSEFLVFRVLALACAGSAEVRVEDIADVANANVEARVGAAAAAAIIAVDSGASAEAEVDRLADEVRDTGCYDVLVTAYRARPVLLSALASRREKIPALFATVANARDQPIARQAGLAVRELERRRALTQRETQVLALVAEGKSNREIAELLVISEATAKLHVRHILNKLGARSRTEAALQATAKLDL
jgi:DNA-binding CsgD family transcriptional regulator